MEFDVWLAFATASLAPLLVPGPTVLLILGYATSQGKRVALARVAGVALGDLLAMTLSLAGLGALLLAPATLFAVLKWAGALYLVYLGVKLFRSAPDASLRELEDTPETPALKVCGHSVAVTALNRNRSCSSSRSSRNSSRQWRPSPRNSRSWSRHSSVPLGLNAPAYASLGESLRKRIATPCALRTLTRIGGAALMAIGIATAALRRSSA